LPATFFGHPRGLATLFFTEMWERFTYYGMRAVLVLFLVAQVGHGGFGIDDKTATAIYGLYTAGAYLAALPGGWIADRLSGARTAVLLGGILIAGGNFLLAASQSPSAFYLGLLIIVMGVGLLKPNVSAMVADLYPEGGARLDAGFTVFYMGINLGGFLGPLVTGEAGELIGPRAPFAATGFFMALGVIQFWRFQRHLGTSGMKPAAMQDKKPWLPFFVVSGVGVAAVIACWLGLIRLNPVNLAQTTLIVISSVAALYFGYLFLGAGLSALEKRRAVVIVVLFLGSVLFWAGYEQAGSSLNLFAERFTDRAVNVIHFVIPTEWLQALNSLFIIIFAPLLAWVWVALGRRQLNPSAPAKFALGVILMGTGFLVMALAAVYVARGEKVLPTWLCLTYLMHTFGELCLSPVGLSFTTKLAPKRLVGQMMGMWFLSLSIGNIWAGLIAGEFDPGNLAAMPGQYLNIVYFAVGLGAALLLLSRPVKKLMGDIT
jgi:POT family proton-dependent oligopeptide transporter